MSATSVNSPPTRAAGDPIPSGELLRIAGRRWLRILTIIMLAGALGFVSSFAISPKYEVKVIAMPRGQDRNSLLSSLAGQFGGIAALAGLGAAENSERAEAVQMLQSQILAREFIEQNNLLPLIFAKDWDPLRHRWRGKERTLNQGVRVFDGSIRGVVEDRRTGLITLRIVWRDPVQAAAWANELVRRGNERLRQRAVTRAEKSLAYLKQEAAKTDTVDIRQALYRLMAEQYKNMLLANVSEEYAFSLIDPAVPPDRGQFKFPNRTLFGLAGLFFGGLFSMIMVFIEANRRST